MLHADASRSGELSARSSATRTPSPVALAPADETPRSTPGQSPASGRPPKSRRTTLQGLHKLLETESKGDGNDSTSMDEAKIQRLLPATFCTDATLQRRAALELAKAGQYMAAQNFLLFAFIHDPPSASIEADLENIVNSTRGRAARRYESGGTTWNDMKGADKDSLRLAHHLLLVKGRPAQEQQVWLTMLLKSPTLFGGPPSHLILAFIELICSEHLDADRFKPKPEPGVKVLAYDDEASAWIPGSMLVPDDRASKPPVFDPSPRLLKAMNRKDEEDEEVVEPDYFDKLAAARTTTHKLNQSGNPLMRKKQVGPPPLYVRVWRYGDVPQRTMWIRRERVLRDVGRGTSKAYIPGVMLLEAAALGSYGVVDALLEHGVSIFETDDEASSALLFAAYNCHTEKHRELCRMLVERIGADPEVSNVHGICPWDCALMRSDVKLRRIFHPNASDLSCTDKALGATELHRSICTGDEKVALDALDKGGGRLENGVTSLMVAARLGLLKVVQALINRGAKPEQKTLHGCTAFSLAAEEGHVPILRTMMAGAHASVAQHLFAADHEGNTPLMRACENGHEQAVEFLLEKAPTPEEAPQAADVLSIDAVNDKGMTALMIAALNGFAPCIELLLDYDARAEVGKPIGDKGKVVHTALCIAAKTGHVECVKALIGADASLAEQRGALALELATKREHSECAEVLRQEGAAGDSGDGDSHSSTPLRQRRQSKDTMRERRKSKDAMKHDGSKSDSSPGGGRSGSPGSKRDTSPKAARQKKKHTTEDAEAVEETNAREQLKDKQSQLSKIMAELNELKTEKKRLKKLQEKGMGKIKLGGMGKEKLEAKPWWAFSPSGKWRPGLGTNPNYTRSAGISREQGEPARSIGWVQLKGEK